MPHITSNLPPLPEDEVRSHFKVFREVFEKSGKNVYWAMPKNKRIIKAEKAVAPYVFGFLEFVANRFCGRKTGLWYLDTAQELWDLLQKSGGAEIGAEYTRFSYHEHTDGIAQGYIWVWQEKEHCAKGLWFHMDSKIFSPARWEEVVEERFDMEQAGIVATMQSLQTKLCEATKNFEDFLRKRNSFNV